MVLVNGDKDVTGMAGYQKRISRLSSLVLVIGVSTTEQTHRKQVASLQAGPQLVTAALPNLVADPRNFEWLANHSKERTSEDNFRGRRGFGEVRRPTNGFNCNLTSTRVLKGMFYMLNYGQAAMQHQNVNMNKLNGHVS